MRLLLKMTVGLCLALAPAAASAATFTVSVGPSSTGGIGNCNIPSAPVTGSSPVSVSGICADSTGVSSGRASSSFGHIGARSDGVALGNNSLVAQFGATAVFTDQLMFTSSDPNATTADVSVNLILDGVMNAAANAAQGGSAGSQLAGYVSLGSGTFLYQYAFSSDGGFRVIHEQFGLTSGVVGPGFNAGFVSPTVSVDLNAPTTFILYMETNAAAVGSSASALTDFSGSFKLPTGMDAFNLPVGVTVNAGDWLVDNRFHDPLAPGAGAPEPAGWALMIAGFGLAGAALRRRRVLVS
ncbi:MAG TPA: PEPxxWA-CTERM sorting domain-containing protein [Phenylobacterium sp.]|jgi:hypothetical protein